MYLMFVACWFNCMLIVFVCDVLFSLPVGVFCLVFVVVVFVIVGVIDWFGYLVSLFGAFWGWLVVAGGFRFCRCADGSLVVGWWLAWWIDVFYVLVCSLLVLVI